MINLENQLIHAIIIEIHANIIIAHCMNAGCMFILLASPDYPGLNHPFCHFWLHEHGWPIKLSDVTEESLDSLEIRYKTEVICAEIDFTNGASGMAFKNLIRSFFSTL